MRLFFMKKFITVSKVSGLEDTVWSIFEMYWRTWLTPFWRQKSLCCIGKSKFPFTLRAEFQFLSQFPGNCPKPWPWLVSENTLTLSNQWPQMMAGFLFVCVFVCWLIGFLLFDFGVVCLFACLFVETFLFFLIVPLSCFCKPALQLAMILLLKSSLRKRLSTVLSKWTLGGCHWLVVWCIPIKSSLCCANSNWS